MASGASRPMLVALIVSSALFMENLDGTVIATALPAIARSLGESPIHLNLGITSYLLSLVIFIPISGWMADRFGARRIFQAAIAVFTLASILCGLCDSLWQLVGARVIQGMGGAMMVPVGRLLLLKNTDKSQLVQAMAYFTMPALIGPVVGPPLGGFITTYASWRWIFLLNLPIGVLGIILVWLYIGDVREKVVRRLDIPGFVLCAVGLSGLVFGFETIGRGVLPKAAVAGLLATGLLAAATYLAYARRLRDPILDLSLFAVPTFRLAVAGGFLFRVGIGALPFLLPLMFQLGFGMSPFESGLLTFAAAVGSLFMKLTARIFLRRFGFRRVLVVDAVIGGASLLACAAFTPATPHALILLLLLLGGFFRSLQFTGLNTLSFADVPIARLSHATSLSSMVQQLSLTVGVAVGALSLHLTLAWTGAPSLSAGDFRPAFIGVGLITMASVLVFLRLAPDAGAEMSGHLAPPAKARPSAPVEASAAPPQAL